MLRVLCVCWPPYLAEAHDDQLNRKSEHIITPSLHQVSGSATLGTTSCSYLPSAVAEGPTAAARQESLHAKAFYCGDEVPTTRRPTRMAAGTGAAPGQAPPDLPSLLLDGRICYIGMPVR